ncbi:MAG TPA: peptidylprolyl isomerase [Anaerolineales bacterium]|nr:peptidylprolyl isomerase [Anaerolineales bacterium]
MFRQNRSFIWILLTFGFALGFSACASVSTPEPFDQTQGGPVSTSQPTFTPLPPSPTSVPMALTVNGEGITVVDFNAEVQRYITAQNGLGVEVSSSDAASAVLQNFIAELLLSQAARADGFTLDAAALQARIDSLALEIGGAEALSAWQNTQGYSEQAFRSALKRAGEAAWMRDNVIASVPLTTEQVHVQQILLYNQDTAESFFAQLNDGADFDELALRADPLTRGDLGWVPRGYLLNEQIEMVAFGLEVGQYSEVITTDVGFHIVKILAQDPSRPLSPDALLALQELALKNWIEEQKALADVVLAP